VKLSSLIFDLFLSFLQLHLGKTRVLSTCNFMKHDTNIVDTKNQKADRTNLERNNTLLINLPDAKDLSPRFNKVYR
jgi:hypothetical protein